MFNLTSLGLIYLFFFWTHLSYNWMFIPSNCLHQFNFELCWVQICNSYQLCFCSLEPQKLLSLSLSSSLNIEESHLALSPLVSLVVLNLCTSFSSVTAVWQVSLTSGQFWWVSDQPDNDPEGVSSQACCGHSLVTQASISSAQELRNQHRFNKPLYTNQLLNRFWKSGALNRDEQL